MDANRFERLLAEARDAEPARRAGLLEQALALWHGLWEQYSACLKPLLEGDVELQGVKAKLLQRGCNLLLLDEPTNDLDVDTLRALEQALVDFAGCVVVISHDRWFLDRIATHMLAFEGDSHVLWFEGNYQDYEADRKRRLGAAAEQPHRIKYRKLTR